jgi:protein-L-isoaspartate(D-aspartate) O-methyltransferase
VGREELLSSLSRRISDERVLAAIAAVPRELFVSRTMAVVARMCELLELAPSDRTLDVGTGSGYHAAVLSRLCEHVWGVELDPRLAARATRALARAGIVNVTVRCGDGAVGLPEQAPFDAINVAATARDLVPPALEAQLADGGRLVGPVLEGHDEHLVRVRRGPGGFEREVFEAVRFVPLRQDV